jgi:tight adherence protein B
MGISEFIILISLAAALAAWGVGQWIMSLIHGERQRLQKRLTSEWRTADVDALLNRSIMMDSELQALPPFLARSAFFKKLNQKLLYAFPEAKLTRFLAISCSVAMLVFSGATLMTDSLMMGFFAGVGALYLPMLIVNSRRTRRQRGIAQQIPEALDFLTRVLKAGHSLSTGIQMMGDELPQPIGGEFRRCYGQHSLGQPLEACLRDMAQRIDSSDFAFFVTAVLIQRQTGGDLSEVLRNISAMVRARLRLQQHVKALTAEGRLTGYILFAFPAVLFVISYVMNPGYAGTLLTTDMGHKLLAAAVSMQFMGLFCIRKIVAVKA